MSQWTDRVKQHPVWQHLADLGPQLDEALKREDIEPDTVVGIERIRLVLTFAGKRLAAIEPDLMHLSPLDGIVGALQTASSEIAAYITDGTSTHVANANGQADGILAQVGLLSYPVTSDDWIALRDAAVSYRTALEQSVSVAHESVERLRQKSTETEQPPSALSENIESERNTFASVVADFQARYTAAEEIRVKDSTDRIQAAVVQLTTDAAAAQQRLTELSTEISAERTRLTSLGSDFQSQFSAAQESRSREFSEGQNSRIEKASTLLADYGTRLTEEQALFVKEREAAVAQYKSDSSDLHEQYVIAGRAVLEQIEQHKADVEKLVGVIGNLGCHFGLPKSGQRRLEGDPGLAGHRSGRNGLRNCVRICRVLTTYAR
jgi:hypothetical protein